MSDVYNDYLLYIDRKSLELKICEYSNFSKLSQNPYLYKYIRVITPNSIDMCFAIYSSIMHKWDMKQEILNQKYLFDDGNKVIYKNMRLIPTPPRREPIRFVMSKLAGIKIIFRGRGVSMIMTSIHGFDPSSIMQLTNILAYSGKKLFDNEYQDWKEKVIEFAKTSDVDLSLFFKTLEIELSKLSDLDIEIVYNQVSPELYFDD